jgi:hypothetical protein
MAIHPKAGYFPVASTVVGNMAVLKVFRDLHVVDSKV